MSLTRRVGRSAFICGALFSASACATHATMLGYRPAQANEAFFVAFLDGGQLQEYARAQGGGVIQMVPARVFRRDPSVPWGALDKGGAQIFRGEAKIGDVPDTASRAGVVQLLPLECDNIPRTISKVDTLTRCVATLPTSELAARESRLLRRLDTEGARDTTLLVTCVSSSNHPCMQGGEVYTLFIGPAASALSDRAMFPMLAGRRSKGVSLLVGALSFLVFFVWDFKPH